MMSRLKIDMQKSLETSLRGRDYFVHKTSKQTKEERNEERRMVFGHDLVALSPPPPPFCVRLLASLV
jgi:hypothetical protein